MTIGIGTAIALSLWAAFCILDLKCFKISLFSRPLLAGLGAGIIMGNIPLGLSVGGTLELMSMGVWNYGGAVIPDYTCAAIIGIAIGSVTGKDFSASIAVAIPVALLFTYFDILAMTYNTFYMHKADKYVKEGNIRKLESMHYLGYLTWAVSRGVPVFLASVFGSIVVNDIFSVCPQWVFTAIGTAGKLFPALGIALLLRMLPVKRYIVYIVLGYFLAAYMKFSFIPITIIGIIVIGTFEIAKKEMTVAKARKEA